MTDIVLCTLRDMSETCAEINDSFIHSFIHLSTVQGIVCHNSQICMQVCILHNVTSSMTSWHIAYCFSWDIELYGHGNASLVLCETVQWSPPLNLHGSFYKHHHLGPNKILQVWSFWQLRQYDVGPTQGFRSWILLLYQTRSCRSCIFTLLDFRFLFLLQHICNLLQN